MPSRAFLIFIGVVSLVLYASVSWLSLQFNWGEGYAHRPIATYVGIYLGLFALYVFACGLIFNGLDDRKTFRTLILFGLLFRAAILPSQQIQEDDIYRYLWDGKVFAHGINPYRYAPSEVNDYTALKIREPDIFQQQYTRKNQEELALLNRLKWEKDTALIFLERVNHPDVPTIYPPMAQYVFRIVHKIFPDSIVGMRLAFLLFDIVAVIFIAKILSALGKNRNFSMIYFWSPLIIKETFNSTHLDIIGISLLCVSIYFLLCCRNYPATFFLSLSFLGKLYPIILFPLYLKQFFLKNRQTGKPVGMDIALNSFLFFAVALLFYLPFLGTGLKTFEGLKTYTVYWQNNDSIFAILVYFYEEVLGVKSEAGAFLSYDMATFLSKATAGIILAGTLVYFLVRQSRQPIDNERAVQEMFILMALVFLLSPVQNPWYLCWVVPFLCVFHFRSFILLTGLVGLYYLDFYFDYQEIPLYSWWLPWFEYVPFYVYLIFEIWERRRNKTLDDSRATA